MILNARLLAGALLLGVILAALGSEAVQAQAEMEKKLLPSLSLDAGKSQRLAPSAQAVKALIAGGQVRRKPDLRFDYTDYRVLRKPAQLFGYAILVVEEEYMAEYVGCCVSPGLGFVLSGEGDLEKLTGFAEANGCSVERPAEISESLRELAPGLLSGQLTYLSCRERDATR